MKKLLLLLPIFVLGACASGGPKLTCDSSNLIALGNIDGEKGKPAETGFEYQKKCEKKGFQISLEDYKQGWEQGIAKYCSPRNGFEMGLKKNKPKFENCPIELRTAFEANFKQGLLVNKNQSKLKDIEKEIKNTRSQIKNLESNIKKANRKLESLEIEKVKISNQIEEVKQTNYTQPTEEEE